MASEKALALLKTDLGYKGKVPTEVETLMREKLDAASDSLAGYGIEIDETLPSDLDLLVMYAAWRYRQRVSSEAMPIMLRRDINDAKVNRATKQEVTA